ncbi:integrase core domain-containing protein [Streptomyces sp. NPDC092307]|uniref:integrase core domain-containing protein n=1 Tax=Streptomyces sp. NPDC092307 TaxID=3366013 RepID=UPI0038144A32
MSGGNAPPRSSHAVILGCARDRADNAAAESFDAPFRRETPPGWRGCSSEREARLDASRRPNRYNTRRRHSRLGQRSPTAYENQAQATATILARAA